MFVGKALCLRNKQTLHLVICCQTITMDVVHENVNVFIDTLEEIINFAFSRNSHKGNCFYKNHEEEG